MHMNNVVDLFGSIVNPPGVRPWPKSMLNALEWRWVKFLSACMEIEYASRKVPGKAPSMAISKAWTMVVQTRGIAELKGWIANSPIHVP